MRSSQENSQSCATLGNFTINYDVDSVVDDKQVNSRRLSMVSGDASLFVLTANNHFRTDVSDASRLFMAGWSECFVFGFYESLVSADGCRVNVCDGSLGQIVLSGGSVFFIFLQTKRF